MSKSTEISVVKAAEAEKGKGYITEDGRKLVVLCDSNPTDNYIFCRDEKGGIVVVPPTLSFVREFEYSLEAMPLPYEEEFTEFIRLMHDGLTLGLKEYGPYGYKRNDLPTMIIEELRDQACYAFFQFLKVQKLAVRIEEFIEQSKVKGTNDEYAS